MKSENPLSLITELVGESNLPPKGKKLAELLVTRDSMDPEVAIRALDNAYNSGELKEADFQKMIDEYKMYAD